MKSEPALVAWHPQRVLIGCRTATNDAHRIPQTPFCTSILAREPARYVRLACGRCGRKAGKIKFRAGRAALCAADKPSPGYRQGGVNPSSDLIWQFRVGGVLSQKNPHGMKSLPRPDRFDRKASGLNWLPWFSLCSVGSDDACSSAGQIPDSRATLQATNRKTENVGGKATKLSAGAFPEMLLPEGAVARSTPQFERPKRDRQGHFPTLRSSGQPITGNVGLSGLIRRARSKEHDWIRLELSFIQWGLFVLCLVPTGLNPRASSGKRKKGYLTLKS